MPRPFVANVPFHADKIPEKDVKQIFKRTVGERVYIIFGVENMFQFCRNCNELKNEKDFHVSHTPDQYGRRKLENTCRTCMNQKNLDIYYLKKENGPPPSHCQLCKKESDKLQLDHCHITRKFRGWLCTDCNVGLGKLRDSVELLEKGIKYLKGEIKYEEDKQEN
jgi:hypothetical protein